ncbi:MAG: GNAT family N-acetyltransferase [Ignavibacteria bacterium]|nr:GNAT family N-acetyltransferase [Ignavibacteria bacterium]
MSLTIIPYDSSWRTKWDEFVRRSNNGTMFHLQQFLDYHPEGRFAWHHLIVLENDEIVSVLPGALHGTVFESPIGASYGSFVTGDIPFAKALDVVDLFGDYCRSNGVERVLLTGPPFIYHRSYSQNIDYALSYRGFTTDKHYISHAIALTDGEFLSRFQSTARRYIHKYRRENELVIDLSDDYDAFYPILVENKNRHRVKPTHTLEELKRLRTLLPDNLVLFLAKHDGQPVAGSLVLRCNEQVALCFYNMLLYEYEEYNPIYALMYEVVKWSFEQGLRWVDIGVSQDTHAENQMTPAMSLITFKEKFDSRGILRSTYYKRFI